MTDEWAKKELASPEGKPQQRNRPRFRRDSPVNSSGGSCDPTLCGSVVAQSHRQVDAVKLWHANHIGIETFFSRRLYAVTT